MPRRHSGESRNPVRHSRRFKLDPGFRRDDGRGGIDAVEGIAPVPIGARAVAPDS